MNEWANVALWYKHQESMTLALECMELYANTEEPRAMELAEQSLQLCERIMVEMGDNSED